MKTTPSVASNEHLSQLPPQTSSTLVMKIVLGLGALTFILYMPLIGYTFANYDDDHFITNNPNVAPGITWAGVKWAFTSTEIDYWRPLSWLSHMLDMELFGVLGGLHHLTSLLIHVASTAMLFLALNRLTKQLWPSAMVAALFAWHPLHVESVAWIAERKDVLCGFFWFYTLWLYARYVEQPSRWRYFQVFLGFILGVMSKPMIATLPCVLLLLDFWPLRRLGNPRQLSWEHVNWQALRTRFNLILMEKFPFFLIVIWLSFSTLLAQQQVGTVSEWIPFHMKLQNALVSYATYLGQTFWPVNLCVLYPLRFNIPTENWMAALLLWVVLSFLSLRTFRRCPFMLVGWLWFVGVLVPTIGLIQVGQQSHADRYTYVPLVGVFIIMVWGIRHLAEQYPRLQRWLTALAVVALIASAIMTRRQLPHWEDSVHIFKRVLEVDPRNATACNNLGGELLAWGKPEEALPYLQRAVSLEGHPLMIWNLAKCHLDLGDYPQARRLFTQAFQSKSDSRTVLTMFGLLRNLTQLEGDRVPERKLLALALAAQKNYSEAGAVLGEIIRGAPTDVEARTDMATCLAAEGKFKHAEALLRETTALAPTNATAVEALGSLLANANRLEEALQHLRAAVRMEPANLDTRLALIKVLLQSQATLEAKGELEEVLHRHENYLPALQELAWLLATHPACRNTPRASELARKALTLERSPKTLDVAAAAAAACGDFATAQDLATQGIELARREGLPTLAQAIRARQQLYRIGEAYIQVK